MEANSKILLSAKSWKIVYVAPMKALAAEMTNTFSKRLGPLGIICKELTGDMQLTRQEIEKTHVLVTTPEKWDVVTRKSSHGEEALARIVKLVIFDEIHLLHDERGPVIESLVARTLRQVEQQQSSVRLVGLSATLPNFIDVAKFLRVDLKKGLFFFDSRFRPIPLRMTFVGVKAQTRIMQQKQMDDICYDKCKQMVEDGHQVMIFVHARKATVNTGLGMIEMAKQNGDSQVFLPENTTLRTYTDTFKRFRNSKNREMGELFKAGFGCHHAGMLRSDRTLVERAFSDGHIRVLCCTATLAWGINLPARCVIIKGTQIYDSKTSKFVDLGILDVQQIFGRAGRPQFDVLGDATIITQHKSLAGYLQKMTRSTPIESRFHEKLVDNLNAEITVGSVSNLAEAMQWLRYTYFFIRIFKNPFAYGCDWAQIESDPSLSAFRRTILKAAANELDKAKMIRFNNKTETLVATDLGRTACNFYINHQTIEQINDRLQAHMEDLDVIDLTSRSSEFQQVKLREEEAEEIAEISAEHCTFKLSSFMKDVKNSKQFKAMNETDQQDMVDACDTTTSVSESNGKVAVLMQAYIDRAHIQSFSLISDLNYISSNAGRILRALFEITLKKGWPQAARKILDFALSFEHRLWPDDNQLWQIVGIELI